MASPKIKLVENDNPLLLDRDQMLLAEVNNIENEEPFIPSYSNTPKSLMPELEELVKKNVNLLLGCGG